MTRLADARIRVAAALDALKRDPLRYWRFGLQGPGLERMRQAFGLFSGPEPIDELHLRACNKGTKTETGAAFMLACLQKRKHLDGVPLPQWRGPVEGAQFVLDYKQQILSVQPAFLRLLGDWPHHEAKTGEILSSLRVMPEGGDPDSDREWSVIHFLSQENRKSGVGVRADIAGFDEPPLIEILREMRKAAHAGRRGIRLIYETPTIRRQWAPIRDDYGDNPRRSLTRIDRYRAELRWSLDDVADWVLSPEEKAALRSAYAHDPLRDAREHGDYTNTEGKCPFNVDALLEMLGDCREPEIVEWRVSRESTEAGGSSTVSKVPVEVYGKLTLGRIGYVCIDPASGVDDNHHNPAGLHVREMGTGALLARWNGYLAPYSVGVLSAGLARQYGNAAIDIEMKDHWGVNVVRGVLASNYGNLCHEIRELRPGERSKEVGFDMNEEMRASLIGHVQEWIDAWAVGIKYAPTPSRKVLECLLDCELDERGKIVAAPGIDHGEDLVLQGRSLRCAVTRSGLATPEIYTPPKSAEQRIAAMIRGESNGDYAPPRSPRKPPRS